MKTKLIAILIATVATSSLTAFAGTPKPSLFCRVLPSFPFFCKPASQMIGNNYPHAVPQPAPKPGPVIIYKK